MSIYDELFKPMIENRKVPNPDLYKQTVRYIIEGRQGNLLREEKYGINKLLDKNISAYLSLLKEDFEPAFLKKEGFTMNAEQKSRLSEMHLKLERRLHLLTSISQKSKEQMGEVSPRTETRHKLK